MGSKDHTLLETIRNTLVGASLGRLPPELRLRIGMARRHREPRYLWGSQLETERRILQRVFRERLGYEPDLLRPRTFNEKLQWRKLFDRRPLLPRLTDKVQVREYVESRVGKEHLIPILFVSDSVATVPLERLPTPYIVKPTHASGVKVPVRSEEDLQRTEIQRLVGDSLRRPHGILMVEWGYWKVPPRVVVERLLLDDEGRVPPDFKIHCFDGEAHFIQVASGRFVSRLQRSTYDRDWKQLDLEQTGLPSGRGIPRPTDLEEMIDFAEVLAAGLDYVRVDMYNLNGRIYFGEMTLYPSSGLRAFSPPEWDTRWGRLWNLPEPTRSA